MTDLFPELNKFGNLLPSDGEAYYYGAILNLQESDYYFKHLSSEIEWKAERLKMMGKEIVLKRKVAWYGTMPFEYSYSGTSKTALPFTADLLDLKFRVEQKSCSTYNACLLNYYPDGESGMAWHSDDENSIVAKSSIASLSFGAPRRFLLKHRFTGEQKELVLEHGSLLEMKGETQAFWLHSVPKSKTIHGARINLTFRKMKE